MAQIAWPQNPYKGLAYYGPEDVLLFAGRDADVAACAELLAQPRTRTLLLHGRTGCGKSSFLRAGLIPTVETRGFGYEFMRSDPDSQPVFIRCTGQPLARIAEDLFHYLSCPQPTETAIGKVNLDFSEAYFGRRDLTIFVEACRDPRFLVDVLQKVSQKLLKTLVIILDQAEEVITLTDELAEDRHRFFEFLKRFNTSNLDVKFVMALRTEYFGQFFGLMRFDASVRTDVKDFLLPELDLEQVKEAIIRPTERESIHDHGDPFSRYRFDYASGVVNEIVHDLFATTQSGGVLPVMQLVCLDLYNEARNRAEPWVIDLALYRTGGSVTGRIDRHITKSLQSAFAEVRVARKEIDVEEERWRKGLYRLVRVEPDGTARTEVINAINLKEVLAEARITADAEEIIGILIRPELLLLRRFSVFNPATGQHDTTYSLSHDAIGLALHQWQVEQNEAGQRREALRRAQRLRRAFIGAATLGAVTAFSLIGWNIWTEEQKKFTLVSALRSAAEREFFNDREIGLAAAVEATLRANDIWYFGKREAAETTKRTLAEMLGQLPASTVRFSGERPTAVRLLPSSTGFFFCCTERQVEFAYVPNLKKVELVIPMVPTGVLSVQSDKKTRLRISGLSEVTPDGMVINVSESGRVKGSDSARIEYFLLIRDNQVKDRYYIWDFEGYSLLDDKGIGKGWDLAVYDGNMVLYRWHNGRTKQEREVYFFNSNAAPSEFPFRQGYRFEYDKLHHRMLNGVLVTVKLESIKATGIDLRAQEKKLLWSTNFMEGESKSAAVNCADSKVECSLLTSDRPFSPNSSRTSLFAVHVIDPTSEITEGAEGSEGLKDTSFHGPGQGGEGKAAREIVQKYDGRPPEFFTIVDGNTGEWLDIPRGLLDGFRRRAVSGARKPSILLRGSLSSFWLALVNDAPGTFDVYHVGDGIPVHHGNYRAYKDSPIAAAAFTGDGSGVLAVSGDVGLYWDLRKSVHERSKELLKRQVSELIELACGFGWGPIKEADWKKQIGVGPPPKDRCAAEPGKSSPSDAKK